MEIIKPKETYQCEYCLKIFETKSVCVNHEKEEKEKGNKKIESKK